ncbi:MAG: ABC transporter ATP-binding protein [Spirochaetaceae bacterium]|nr:MAG: ABC transporter ATP-binding protein [Spirochaetaceae bacterium]
MALRIQGIEKVYPDFRLELDFEVRQGELLILLGPSGCGKTTTLRLIAGFIDPDHGSLHVDGRRIDTLPAHRRRIGIVFQDYALFPHLNVRDNIGFGLRMQGWSSTAAKQRIGELLGLVSLEVYGKRKVTHLSGGEQQRVALARALAPQPQLLLLDEPLSALDAKLRKSLRTEIRRIQRELGITTLYVTHDQEEALVLGDRIAVMRDGHIEQIDTPDNIYNRPRNLFVGTFLGQANLVQGRLSGRLSGREGELAVVETPVGALRARWPSEARTVRIQPLNSRSADTRPAAEELSLGAEVIVFFRPEHCSLNDRAYTDIPKSTAAGASNRSGSERTRGPARTNGSNRIGGRITRKEYMGSHQLVEVEAGSERFTLDLAEERSLSVDDQVQFSVDPRKVCLFPAAKY